MPRSEEDVIRRGRVPNVVLVLVESSGAIQAGVIASFTNTHKPIPRRRKAAHTAATLTPTALGSAIVIIQSPTKRVLQGHSIDPVSGVRRVIPERYNRSIGTTLHGFQVELPFAVEVGGGVDAAGVAGREEGKAEGDDGGTRVE